MAKQSSAVASSIVRGEYPEIWYSTGSPAKSADSAAKAENHTSWRLRRGVNFNMCPFSRTLQLAPSRPAQWSGRPTWPTTSRIRTTVGSKIAIGPSCFTASRQRTVPDNAPRGDSSPQYPSQRRARGPMRSAQRGQSNEKSGQARGPSVHTVSDRPYVEELPQRATSQATHLLLRGPRKHV